MLRTRSNQSQGPLRRQGMLCKVRLFRYHALNDDAYNYVFLFIVVHMTISCFLVMNVLFEKVLEISVKKDGKGKKSVEYLIHFQVNSVKRKMGCFF